VLESAHDETGCELLRTAGSHRHYSNPFRPDRLITFAWHPGGTSAGRILLAAPEVNGNWQMKMSPNISAQ
jgi:predicted RNA binding protein YcfA (HicA-like mRNA interferase family)